MSLRSELPVLFHQELFDLLLDASRELFDEARRRPSVSRKRRHDGARCKHAPIHDLAAVSDDAPRADHAVLPDHDVRADLRGLHHRALADADVVAELHGDERKPARKALARGAHNAPIAEDAVPTYANVRQVAAQHRVGRDNGLAVEVDVRRPAEHGLA